jgi:uncharacterized lipoprotein YajG
MRGRLSIVSLVLVLALCLYEVCAAASALVAYVTLAAKALTNASLAQVLVLIADHHDARRSTIRQQVLKRPDELIAIQTPKNSVIYALFTELTRQAKWRSLFGAAYAPSNVGKIYADKL